MIGLFYAAAGGAIGAASRYLIGVWMLRLLGSGFPWSTLLVNITGAFLMGLLIEMATLRMSLSQEMRIFLITGILGGFTTFSAFALDFAVLWQRQAFFAACAYAGTSVVMSIGALFLGLKLARVM
ncbi:MAG: fluoride efflux transporter CrcB [Pseudomonadota bacterium]